MNKPIQRWVMSGHGVPIKHENGDWIKTPHYQELLQGLLSEIYSKRVTYKDEDNVTQHFYRPDDIYEIFAKLGVTNEQKRD